MDLKNIIKNKVRLNTIVISGILIGIFLRFYHFGSPPVGLASDEASIIYESFSLSETGNDRWGYSYPVYFISWGSGQNTLYAYLSIPFVKYFGLNLLSVRIISGILGMFTLLFVFLLLLNLLKKNQWALIGTLLYTFNPWHFMVSRWGFEENPVPFFVILGLYLLFKTQDLLSENRKLVFNEKFLILISWLPFAVMLYTYASTLFVISIFIPLFTFLNYTFIKKQISLYLSSLIIFIIVAFPFLLFILKNNILKKTLEIEKGLPFSLPLMLYERDRLIKPISDKIREIYENSSLIYRSLSDKNVYNVTSLGVPHFFSFLALIGIIYSFDKYRNNNNLKFGTLLAWGISSLTIFLLFYVNLNRSIHLQSIIPVYILLGLYFLSITLKDNLKKYFIITITSVFVFMSSVFMIEYFKKYPQYSNFVIDFDDAILKAETFRQKDENIAVTPTLIQNYLYTCVYTKFPPAEFQKANWKHANNRPYVYSFGHYYMLGTIEYYALDIYQNNIDLLANQKSNIYIVKNSEKPTDGTSQLLYSNKFWSIYRCQKTKNFTWNRS